MDDLNIMPQEIQEEQLNQALEAMYFGFKAIIAKPDQHLATLNLSRVHHRILYFIARNSQLSVKELLTKLDVSKQYIHQPMRKLIEEEYVLAERDLADRRIKRLSLTTKGSTLEVQLSGIQREQFKEVFEQVGKEAEKNWKHVMKVLIHKTDLPPSTT